MKLLDILTEPWAITPEKKKEIDEIYAAHLRGEKIDISAIEAANGGPLNNQQSADYQTIDGVAVIEIDGVMAKKMNLFSRISGGSSTQMLSDAVHSAVSDPAVTAILLVIDSPGGAVDGIQELVTAIRSAAAVKPTAAVADLMASAAYWAGSAASKIYASSSLAMIGSIGVVATHVDVSAAQTQRGVKTTEITAGKFKRIASSYSPLSESGQKSIQDQVDYIYNLFLTDVGAHRGVDGTQQVHDQMADGRMFIGQQAVDAGLVDGIATVSEVIAMLGAGDIPLRPSTDASGAVPPSRAGNGLNARAQSGGGAPSATNNSPEITMDAREKIFSAEETQAKVDAAVASTTAAFEASKPALREEGATAERTRIQGVRAQTMKGHEALIETLAFDGKTTAEQAAVQVLAAEKSIVGKIGADVRADAPKPAPNAPDKPEALDEDSDEAKAAKAARMDPAAVSKKATAYQAEQKKLGNIVSASDAVAHVTAQGAK